MIELINKKRLGLELTRGELEAFFFGYLNQEVKDYQMSAMLMAICIHGLSDKEVFNLVDIFIASGISLDLSSLGTTVDKHSTGGVGDKTTLIVGPIVSSCGVKVPKMSGRGLGHTGGTIDKIESIPSFNTHLTIEEFIDQLEHIGFALMSQTDELTPLDKMIYALRDVTGTVESIPLIAISIMSKKIALGASHILIDIKLGKGALIKTKEEALEISRLMMEIGKKYHREVRTMITNMDHPLGDMIGNTLEVLEAMETLKGRPGPLMDLCVEIASEMVSMGKNISVEEAKKRVLTVIENGDAFQQFLWFVEAQGGRLDELTLSDTTRGVYAAKTGIVIDIDALKMGNLSVHLGAGRLRKEDSIDPLAGIMIHKNVGSYVKKGEVLYTAYYTEPLKVELTDDAFTII